jgi:hypothetical protein
MRMSRTTMLIVAAEVWEPLTQSCSLQHVDQLQPGMHVHQVQTTPDFCTVYAVQEFRDPNSTLVAGCSP